MILDRLIHRDSYSSMAELKIMLDRMAEIQIDSLPDGKEEISENGSFLFPVQLITKPLDQCRYEAHRKYADIHCILAGTEEIIVSDLSTVTEIEPYSDEKDIGFYEGNEGTVCIQKPGDFLICFPQDAHRVAIAPTAPGRVIKLVGKIPV